MKRARSRTTKPTPHSMLAVALGVLALSSPVGAGPTAPEQSVQELLDLESVLASARTAAGRDAWGGLKHGLRMTGKTNAGGIDADIELFFTADGRYRFEMDGRIGRTLTFDGEVAASRVRSGPTRVLRLSDRESWHYSQWVHSGYWLDAGCPVEVELVSDTADEVSLRIGLAGSPSPALLTLDRGTWLPKEMRRTTLGSENLMTFEQYESVAGVSIARRVLSSSHGVDTEVRVLEAAAAPEDPGTRYQHSTAPAQDVRFDHERPPTVELKRVRSGHLLVHPLVDGKDTGWFILDTGAGQICIDPKVADELELESFGSVPAVGVAGAVKAGYRQGKTLEIGPMLLEDPVYVEIDLSFLAPVFGVEVAGICGYEVFARAVVELDLEETRLSLHDPGQFDLADDAWTPLVVDSRIPCISCRFEGDREGLFKIDLGDSGTISFYAPAVQSLGLLEGRDVRPSMVGGVGGVGKASDGDLEWFEIGGRRIEPLPATFSQTESGAFSSSYALGNLGTHMLKPFVVVFDYPNSRIALLPRE